jgi:HD-GYP domain-containing protein (c-di-GMP phosphodiesterase class II)
MSFEDVLRKKETDRVLEQILERAVDLTSSDGGSIYFIERNERLADGPAKVLRFHYSLNKTLQARNTLKSQAILIDEKSFAGYVALTGKPLRVDDCYALDPSLPCKFNPSFDKKFGYKTTSTMAIPIVSEESGNSIIGVIQLINKMNDGEAIPFTKQDEVLIGAMASQTAIALEKVELHEEIEELFESFVQASVTAIEARDPTTSGHSERVANMTVELAKTHDGFTVDQIQELRYASLLHDFGKIGVREEVLLKSNKLYPHELETIMLRMDLLKQSKETELWRSFAKDKGKLTVDKIQNKVLQFSDKIEEVRELIKQADKSQVLKENMSIAKLIQDIKDLSKGFERQLLTEDEFYQLSIERGSLTPGEREEIESHVTQTYLFLKTIAWSKKFSNVPTIAYAHHEKLDGTGYPRKIISTEIPVQSKMLTICDIFDALTASDRPYKKALGLEKALDILHMERKAGKVDPNLLEIFIERKIFDFGLKHPSSVNKKVA